MVDSLKFLHNLIKLGLNKFNNHLLLLKFLIVSFNK